MAIVTVPVLKPLIYQGRSYVRGAQLRVPAIEAAAMARRGEVSLTKGVLIAPVPTVQRRDMEAEPPTGRARRGRRRYQRRDMTPETPVE